MRAWSARAWSVRRSRPRCTSPARPPDEHTRLREASARQFAGRGCPPEKVADAVLRAIVRNTAVVAVTPDARAVRLMSRFAPRLRAVVARLDP